MRQMWKRVSLYALIAVVILALSPQRTFADPLGLRTITVTFAVGGDNSLETFGEVAIKPVVDPVFGDATSTGSFSFSSRLIPAGGGQLLDFEHGVFGPADGSLQFSWAGTDWSLATAAVPLLQFDASGSLVEWGLGAFRSGVGGTHSNAPPDFVIFGILTSKIPFIYITPDSQERGLFVGRLLSWSVSEMEVSPTPEPGSLMLVGGGLLAAAVRARRKRSD